MREKRYMLIKVFRRKIMKPEFFNTYDEAHAEMKREYENYSDGGVGELNDDDAWCKANGREIDWKIFDVD